MPHSICCCNTFFPQKMIGEFLLLMSNIPYKSAGKGAPPASAPAADSAPPTAHAPAWRRGESWVPATASDPQAAARGTQATHRL